MGGGGAGRRANSDVHSPSSSSHRTRGTTTLFLWDRSQAATLVRVISGVKALVGSAPGFHCEEEKNCLVTWRWKASAWMYSGRVGGGGGGMWGGAVTSGRTAGGRVCVSSSHVLTTGGAWHPFRCALPFLTRALSCTQCEKHQRCGPATTSLTAWRESSAANKQHQAGGYWIKMRLADREQLGSWHADAPQAPQAPLPPCPHSASYYHMTGRGWLYLWVHSPPAMVSVGGQR